ncbi:KR domain-containing protein [Camillea tinctor]|nr:KR domain-containing protein [Camillea tinctor]
MTYDQWRTTIRSKVNVSWNLHRLLPELEFFVLLSSLSGIYGSKAQANYAAGCTFQDSLARYRTLDGERSSVSIDLGWMRTIGIIAVTESYRRHRENARDMIPLEEEELLAVLDLYCRPHPEKSLVGKSQLLVGPVTPAHYAIRGQSPDPSMLRCLFSTFARVKSAAATETQSSTLGNAALAFSQATDLQQRANIVTGALVDKLARALSVPVGDIQLHKQLFDYGVDSLMAIELRNLVGKEFGAQVAVFDIMGGSVTIASIGSLVAERAKMS